MSSGCSAVSAASRSTNSEHFRASPELRNTVSARKPMFQDLLVLLAVQEIRNTDTNLASASQVVGFL